MKLVVNELAALRKDVAALTERLNAVLTALPIIPADATEAANARASAILRGFFTVKEFAAVMGRSPQWVSDRCAARVVKTLAGGKPYRIPLSEDGRWNGGAK